MSGDKIDIEVYAKYYDPDNMSNQPNFVALMLSIFDRDPKFLDGGARQLQGVAGNGTDVDFKEINAGSVIVICGNVYLPIERGITVLSDILLQKALQRVMLTWPFV